MRIRTVTVKTDADGNFTLENVKAGRYTVRAQHDGFAETVMNGVTVEARQDVRLTVALVGGGAEFDGRGECGCGPDQQRECGDWGFEGQHCDDAVAAE